MKSLAIVVFALALALGAFAPTATAEVPLCPAQTTLDKVLGTVCTNQAGGRPIYFVSFTPKGDGIPAEQILFFRNSANADFVIFPANNLGWNASAGEATQGFTLTFQVLGVSTYISGELGWTPITGRATAMQRVAVRDKNNNPLAMGNFILQAGGACGISLACPQGGRWRLPREESLLIDLELSIAPNSGAVTVHNVNTGVQ